MKPGDDDLKRLLQAGQEAWRAMRGRDLDALAAGLHPEFQATGFPCSPDLGAPDPDPGDGEDPPAALDAAAAAQRLSGFFREGSGLTGFQHRIARGQIHGDVGIALLEWMAEKGLGEGGSPRFLSGTAVLTFRRDGGAWKLSGWLGSLGPHAAQSAEDRAADCEAIREQILRVFEAYRQKDRPVLRRTHTADWRGFALSSAAVGRGIDAYMRAAERAMGAMQFQEYRITDFDAVFYGDLAIVPYIAVVAGRDAQGQMQASRLRVIDVYLREPTGWNQVASNVCLHPEDIISR